MKTLETIALGTIFPENRLESIMEVVAATPNGKVALDILLGIYVEPTLKQTATLNDRLCTLVRYDKWTDKVYYDYHQHKQKHIYVDKDLDTSIITEENYSQYAKKYSDNNVIGFYVKLSEIEKIQSEVYSETWINGQKKF